MPDAPETGRHFSVTLPSNVYERLTAIAKQDGSSLSSVVRRAVLAWLRRADDQTEAA